MSDLSPHARPIWPRRFLLRWTLACAGGELVGIGAAAAIAVGFNAFFGEPDTPGLKLLNIGIMLVAGTVEGGTLGWLQWRVLRELFPAVPRSKWMGFTILVAVLGWLIGMSPSVFFGNGGADPAVSSMPEPPLILVLGLAAAGGAVLGAVFGLFQWIVLRHYARAAGQWILANAIGWSVAMVLIFLAATLPTEETASGLVIAGGIAGGIFAGLSLGLVTGLYWKRMWQAEHSDLPPT